MEVRVIDISDPLWPEILKGLRHDFYHLPEYVALEGDRIGAVPEAVAISEDGAIFFLPYLLRQCDRLFEGAPDPPKIFDVVSPYGYPGILLNEVAVGRVGFLNSAINQLVSLFQTKNVCSAFFRLHPILNRNFELENSPGTNIKRMETVSIDLQQSTDEIWHQTRSEHRNKINKCKRAGFTARFVDFHQYIDSFREIYEETMNRVGASQLYYFSEEYFVRLSEALGQRCSLCLVELDGQIACAGLFAEHCGIIQYHLGGTKSEFLKQAPSKLMFDRARFWAKERGNEIFHLGGGVGSAKDSLYHFKAGFSQQRETFVTLSLIADAEKYNYLIGLRAKLLNIEPERLFEADFFPAYRASLS